MTHAADWVQAARLYVIVVASLVAIVGTAQVHRWRSFLLENQLAWLAVAAFNFSAFFGCLDQYVNQAPGGARTYITALATTWALYAVCHYPVHALFRWWRARRLIARHDPKGKL